MRNRVISNSYRLDSVAGVSMHGEGGGLEGGGVTRGRSGQSSGACPVYVHITFNLGGILRWQRRWLNVGLRGVCRSPVASPAVSLKPK